MRWKGILSKAAACPKPLVCDEAWKASSETACCVVRLDRRVWCGAGGGRLQGLRTDTGKGFRVPVSLATGCAPGKEQNEQNNRHFRSNHSLVVLKAFVIEAYFQILEYLATFLKRINDSNSVNKSAIMKHDKHQCLFGSKKYPVFKCICWLFLST